MARKAGISIILVLLSAYTCAKNKSKSLMKKNTQVYSDSSTKIEVFLGVVLGATLDQPKQEIRQKRDNRKWGGFGGPEHFFRLLGGQADSPTHPDHFYPYLHEEARDRELKLKENSKNLPKNSYQNSFREHLLRRPGNLYEGSRQKLGRKRLVFLLRIRSWVQEGGCSSGGFRGGGPRPWWNLLHFLGAI